jgi:hypothetical protein
VPAGRAAKASFVGAKTVKGPSPFRVSTRPAAVTAETRVLKRSSEAAMSTIDFGAVVGSMVAASVGAIVGWGMAVGSAVAVACGAQAAKIRVKTSIPNKYFVFIVILSCLKFVYILYRYSSYFILVFQPVNMKSLSLRQHS